MVFSRIKIEDFQSLEDVDLALKPFTVIVGQSNSGKSALGRAFRVLTRNTFSPGFVTNGKKSSRITVWDGEDSATVERGKSLSAFELNVGGSDSKYEKTGVTVPEAVEDWLKTPLDSLELHYTTQFDAPFLMDAAGSQVSSVLGALTNVTLLAEASKEANRRRLHSSQTAQVRESDSARLANEAKERFATLNERKQLVEEARALFDGLNTQVLEKERITSLTGQISVADTALAHISDSITEDVALLDKISQAMATLKSKLDEVSELKVLLAGVARLDSELDDASASVEMLSSELKIVEKEKADALAEAGICPLCGSETHGPA